MTVVVVAPHPDDEAIGIGGTLRQHSLAGDRVVVVFLSSGEGGVPETAPDVAGPVREAEAEAAADILGVSELIFLRGPDGELDRSTDRLAPQLRDILAAEAPDVIYLPHPMEAHPDHMAALPIVRSALPADCGPDLAGFEVWTPASWFDDVRIITDVWADKLAAIRCYASQLEQFRYDDAAEGLARYRGALAGRASHAEVLQYQDPTGP